MFFDNEYLLQSTFSPTLESCSERWEFVVASYGHESEGCSLRKQNFTIPDWRHKPLWSLPTACYQSYRALRRFLEDFPVGKFEAALIHGSDDPLCRFVLDTFTRAGVRCILMWPDQLFADRCLTGEVKTRKEPVRLPSRLHALFWKVRARIARAKIRIAAMILDTLLNRKVPERNFMCDQLGPREFPEAALFDSVTDCQVRLKWNSIQTYIVKPRVHLTEHSYGLDRSLGILDSGDVTRRLSSDSVLNLAVAIDYLLKKFDITDIDIRSHPRYRVIHPDVLDALNARDTASLRTTPHHNRYEGNLYAQSLNWTACLALPTSALTPLLAARPELEVYSVRSCMNDLMPGGHIPKEWHVTTQAEFMEGFELVSIKYNSHGTVSLCDVLNQEATRVSSS